MQVIHFTRAAADPLGSSGARRNRTASQARPHVGTHRLQGMRVFRTGARFVPLLEGQGSSHVSCLHLNANARIASRSLSHAAALLVVYTDITVTTLQPQTRIDIHAGMSCVFEAGEPYAIESSSGAIVIIVDSDSLVAHERGISNPGRIAGAIWPTDAASN